MRDQVPAAPVLPATGEVRQALHEGSVVPTDTTAPIPLILGMTEAALYRAARSGAIPHSAVVAEARRALHHDLTVSVRTAATLLGIDPSAAYRAARSGSLPAIRVGGRYLISTAELRRLLGLEGAAG